MTATGPGINQLETGGWEGFFRQESLDFVFLDSKFTVYVDN